MSGRPQLELAFEGLEIGYGRRRVAGPMSGRLRAGSVWVLTGPNGSGKTTLLRTLLGLLPALGGRVERPHGTRASYVPQLSGMDPVFPVTCQEVVATGLPLSVRRQVRRERIGNALSRVGLGELSRRPFFELSGGQRQRVLLARALCGEADLVALDEPTAGVDVESSVVVWESIRQLAADGRLVIVVTHDLFSAPDYADHVLTIADGGLVERAVGAPP